MKLPRHTETNIKKINKLNMPRTNQKTHTHTRYTLFSSYNNKKQEYIVTQEIMIDINKYQFLFWIYLLHL
jgi:hypothetical protein